MLSRLIAARSLVLSRAMVRRLGWAALVAWAFGVPLLLISCSTSAPHLTPPVIEGATFVGNDACRDCHAEYVRTFSASSHGGIGLSQLALSSSTQSGHEATAASEPSHPSSRPDDRRKIGMGKATAVACEACHGPGSRHVALGGKGTIFNPGRSPQTCFDCHIDIHADFKLPQHHPVTEGRMTCVQCHDPHGTDIMKPAGGLAMSKLNQQCSTCHREQARRFVFEHEALRDGCVSCHQPHGSNHGKMLAQPDANLCLRCHAQVQNRGQLFIGKVDHRTFIRRGTCWTSTCHTAVHGSNVDPYLRY